MEEARQGIDSGKYGGYVLIPSNFSTNSTSVNGTQAGITMEYAIGKQNADHLTYVGDVYEATGKHVTTLGEMLIAGNDASKAKLELGLADAKDFRTTINAKNEELLTAFTK